MIDPFWLMLLQGYGAIGAITCVAFIAFATPKDQATSKKAQGIETPLRPIPLMEQIKGLLTTLCSRALGVLILVGAWPLVWLSGLLIWRDGYMVKVREKRAIFQVQRKHLKALCQVQTVEHEQRVKDPLGAVPDLPFGHLHPVWAHFLAQHTPEAQLWSFECKWEDPWGHAELRSGYVWMQDQLITHWAVMDKKRLERQGDRHVGDR